MPGEFLAFSLLSGIRRAESQGLLAVVVDRTFTCMCMWGGHGLAHASLFIDHRRISLNFIFHVLNFRGWSRLRNYFNFQQNFPDLRYYTPTST